MYMNFSMSYLRVILVAMLTDVLAVHKYDHNLFVSKRGGVFLLIKFMYIAVFIFHVRVLLANIFHSFCVIFHDSTSTLVFKFGRTEGEDDL